MAESLDVGERPGTSDFYYDPHCEGCQEDGLNVEPVGFCEECGTFMCQHCHRVHSRLPSTRDHTIKTGDNMPRSMNDKPVRYPRCDKYARQINDRFCLDHQEMICSKCQSEVHTVCEVKTIADACSHFDSAAHGRVVGQMKDAEKSIADTQSSLQSNMERIDKQKCAVASEVRNILDNTVSKVQTLHKNIEAKIDEVTRSEKGNLKAQLTSLSAIEDNLKSSLQEITTIVQGSMNPTKFIRYQELMNIETKRLAEMHAKFDDLKDVNISFKIDEALGKFLAHVLSFGNVFVNATALQLQENANKNIDYKSVFPKQTPVKMGTFGIKAPNDRYICDVCAIDVTNSGKVIVLDNENKNAKVFAEDGQFIFNFWFGGYVGSNMCVVADKAVVCIPAVGVVVIDLSNEAAFTKLNKIKMNFTAPNDICGCGGNIAVVCNGTVKAVDMKGVVLWSVKEDSHKRHFKKLSAITDYENEDKIVLVTDSETNTITTLKADTGEVLMTSSLGEKSPRSIAVDKIGRVYVCYSDRTEIDVWSKDLKQTNCLINDCTKQPQTICIDKERNKLFVSYPECDVIDIYDIK